MPACFAACLGELYAYREWHGCEEQHHTSTGVRAAEGARVERAMESRGYGGREGVERAEGTVTSMIVL